MSVRKLAQIRHFHHVGVVVITKVKDVVLTTSANVRLADTEMFFRGMLLE